MTREKQKRDLLSQLNRIERFYQRRMVLNIHILLSLAIQFVIWANWYSSYASRGVGFENNFFADRIIISIVLLLFLLGHYSITRLMESKDLLVIKAIQKYDMDADIETHATRLADNRDETSSDTDYIDEQEYYSDSNHR